MKFIILAELMQKLEETPSRLEKTQLIADFIQEKEDLKPLLRLLQGRVFPDWNNTELGVSKKTVLKAISSVYGVNITAIEQNFKKTGDVGKVAQEFSKNKTQQTLASFSTKKELTLQHVYTTIKSIADIEGSNSVSIKSSKINELLSDAEPIEAKFIIRIVVGDLRIGVSTGTLRDALIRGIFPKIIGLYDKDINKEVQGKIYLYTHKETALKQTLLDYDYIKTNTYEEAREIYNLITDKFQEAYDKINDISRIAEIAKHKGLKGLTEITLEVMTPLRAMLMQKVNKVEEAEKKIPLPFALEFKYDGFRCQIHKQKNNIKLFTRNLEDVTFQFTDVVDLIKRKVKAESVILDGEILGKDTQGNYLPFQAISQRIKRKHNIQELVKKLPVSYTTWDILYHNGKSIIDLPLHERRALLKSLIENDEHFFISEQKIISSIEEGEKFYKESLAKGNEGVVVKDLHSSYKPGNRVGCWLKIKPIMDPLDLVIVGAQWGEGKRSSWLTSYIIACYDKDQDTFLEIGKVGSGLKEIETEKKAETDLTFSEMTELLKPLIDKSIPEKNNTVTIQPKIVITVAYEEIQTSNTYQSGFALRFPRFLGLRDDLDTHEADDIEKIKDYFEQQ